MGKSLKDCTILISSLFACEVCARMIIQSGIKKIIAPHIDEGNWKDSNSVAITMLKESKIEVCFSEELSKLQMFSSVTDDKYTAKKESIRFKTLILAVIVIDIFLVLLNLSSMFGLIRI